MDDICMNGLKKYLITPKMEDSEGKEIWNSMSFLIASYPQTFQGYLRTSPKNSIKFMKLTGVDGDNFLVEIHGIKKNEELDFSEKEAILRMFWAFYRSEKKEISSVFPFLLQETNWEILNFRKLDDISSTKSLSS